MSDTPRWTMWCTASHGHAPHVEPDGDFVLFSDYDRELSAAQARVRELEDEFAEFREGYVQLHKELNTSISAYGKAVADNERLRKDAEAGIRRALRGIDQTETDDPDGWWETSTGAEFGARRLQAAIDAALAQPGGGE